MTGQDWALIIGAAGLFITGVGGFLVKAFLDIRTANAALAVAIDKVKTIAEDGALVSSANRVAIAAVAIQQDENAKAMDGKLTELMNAKVAAAKHEGGQEADAKRAASDASENLGRLKAQAEAAPAAERIAKDVIAAMPPPVSVVSEVLASEATLEKVLDKLPTPKPEKKE